MTAIDAALAANKWRHALEGCEVEGQQRNEALGEQDVSAQRT